MKSIGNLAAELKERMEFSLMAFILESELCKTFMPCPLWPITKNFGILNDIAVLFNSNPTSKQRKVSSSTTKQRTTQMIIMIKKQERRSCKFKFEHTFGKTGGVERDRSVFWDLVEVWDVGEMIRFKSHCYYYKS